MPKKMLCFMLAALLALGCAACGEAPVSSAEAPAPSAEPTPEPSPEAVFPELLEEDLVDDHCGNWYEVFVYSYADSDGDGIGDFKGLESKLDYIRGMGFTGIWLMPIMPSPSYHKYDVTDYYDVDAQYGSMEDFRALLSAAHEKGIKIIIDLPVNHTSSSHPWFTDALSGEDAQYRDYYNFTDEPLAGHTPIAGGGYYESQFVSTMPDLNLDSETVRAEIVSIMSFWLSDVGVDGFRLDATTSYYTGSPQASIDFLNWLNTEAKAISPDCYIVGECWSDMSTILQYYESGIDSFFYFPAATSSGSIFKTLQSTITDRGQRYSDMSILLEETFGADTVMAPFLGNHDTGRITGSITNSDMGKLKAATGMLAMMRGAVFVYYGDEIGMVGSGEDPNKRIGMLWTSEDETTAAPPGTTKVRYLLPSVSEQEADPDSLLVYTRQAMNLRNAVPAIARGSSEALDSGDPMVSVIRRTWNGESILIVLNLCEEAKTLSLESGGIIGILDATGEGITYENGILSIAAWGIAVLEG